MTAREYLGQYRFLTKEIDSLQQRIDELRANTMQAKGIDYSVPRVDGGGGGDLVLKMIELQEELNERRIEKIEQEKTIRQQINAMRDKRHALILQARYIDGMTLADIATELGYSLSHITRLSSDALSEFDEMFLQDDRK